MGNFLELRKEKGLSQIGLAKILNVDQTTISKWEKGKALPDAHMLLRLSELYDVSIDYLLGNSTYYYPDRVSQFSADEREILSLYGTLSSSRKEDLKIYLRALSGAETKPEKKKA